MSLGSTGPISNEGRCSLKSVWGLRANGNNLLTCKGRNILPVYGGSLLRNSIELKCWTFSSSDLTICPWLIGRSHPHSWTSTSQSSQFLNTVYLHSAGLAELGNRSHFWVARVENGAQWQSWWPGVGTYSAVDLAVNFHCNFEKIHFEVWVFQSRQFGESRSRSCSFFGLFTVNIMLSSKSHSQIVRCYSGKQRIILKYHLQA